MIGIEELFEEEIHPEMIFRGQDVPAVRMEEEEVARALSKLNVNGWDEKRALKAVREVVDSNNRHYLWLYYSLAYAYLTELKVYDKFSFAAMLTSIVAGYEGFEKDLNDKELMIAARWRSMEKMLMEMDCEPLTIAKIAITFLEDQYRKPENAFGGEDEPADNYFHATP